MERDGRGRPLFPGVAVDVTARRLAEAEAGRAHALIEGIARSTDDLIAAQDAHFRYLFVNEAYRREFTRLWGRRIEIGTDMVEALAPWPEDQATACALWRRALEGESFSVTESFGPPGQRQIYDLRFNPVRDAGGRLIGAAHILRNVTERVGMQRALAESEATLRAVLDALPVGVVIADPEGRVVGDNAAHRALWGVLPPETNHWREYADWVGFWAGTGRRIAAGEWAMARALLKGEVVKDELVECVRFGDGEPRLYLNNAAPVRDADGRIVAGVVAELDVTERLAAERALAESESFFRQTLESIPGMAFTNTPDGACDYVSEQWARYTGIPVPEHLGDGWLRVLHPDDRERAFAAWRTAVAGRGRYDLEYRVRRGDGRYQWFKVRGRAIRDGAGTIVRWFGTAMNVNDLKRAESGLREAGRRKDELLATLAHELRNPLAPLRTGLETLRLAGGDPQYAAQALEMMDRQLDQMVRLVDDLLDVSRISRGKIELRRERVDLAAVVASAVETSRPLIESRRHRLGVDLPPEPLALDADPVRLAQVFANLLNNAAKYTEPGGTISLRAERRGDEVLTWVRDDGMGIPAEVLPSVFELFTQDRTLDKTGGGLGIGLHIVRRLTEMHGGSVEAGSEGRGRGSVFLVRLPLAVREAE